jgi:siroheme synthase (precorrin-2 oxidase/ferrochelatase)
MLPVVLIDDKKILCIGAGKAVAIKLKILTKVYDDITVISKEFVALDKYKDSIKPIVADFYDLSIDEILEYDIIYLGIEYPTDKTKENQYIQKVSQIKQSRLICVLGNHKLGNFIHPCTREYENIKVSVSTSGKSPALSCKLADELIQKAKDIVS